MRNSLTQKRRNRRRHYKSFSNAPLELAEKKRKRIKSTVNIILAALTLCISVFIAFRQIDHEDKLQMSQQKYESENSYAKMEVMLRETDALEETLSSPIISIRNTGKIYITNIKINISLITINQNWISVVNNINAFQYNQDSNSHKIDFQYMDIDDNASLYSTLSGENTMVITVDSLAPSEALHISIVLKPEIEIKECNIKRPCKLSLSAESRNSTPDVELYKFLTNYFAGESSIASFQISVTADNLFKAPNVFHEVRYCNTYNMQVEDVVFKRTPDKMLYDCFVNYILVEPIGLNSQIVDSPINCDEEYAVIEFKY